MKNILSFILCAFLLSGCGVGNRTIKKTVSPVSDPSVNFGDYKAFVVVPTSETAQLTEKHLLSSIVRNLERKGFKYDTKLPDFLVYIVFGVTSRREYTPPKNIYYQDYVPGKTARQSGMVLDGNGHILNYWGTSRESGYYETKTRLSPGKAETVYDRSFLITIYDMGRYLAGDTTPIWQSFSNVYFVEGPSKMRMDRYGPFVVEEMMADFPRQSSKGGKGN